MQSNKVIVTCDLCGKSFSVQRKTALRESNFHACPGECRNTLRSVYAKAAWAALTPEERENRLIINNSAKGLRDYHKSLRPERVEKVVKFMSEPPKKMPARYRYTTTGVNHSRYDAEIPQGVCTILAAHHEMLKDDPERLSTEFMQDIIGTNCQCKTKKPLEWEGEINID